MIAVAMMFARALTEGMNFLLFVYLGRLKFVDLFDGLIVNVGTISSSISLPSTLAWCANLSVWTIRARNQCVFVPTCAVGIYRERYFVGYEKRSKGKEPNRY